MNFEFNEDQRMLREQARRFLLDKSSPEVVRKTLENEQAFDSDLWKQFAAMGWLGAAIPEEYGGSGLGHLELCVIAEELGRSLAPTPFASSIYLGAEALMKAGTEEQKQVYLPDIATGKAIWCLALSEGPRPITEKNIAVSELDGKLSGEKFPVVDGDTDGTSNAHAVKVLTVGAESRLPLRDILDLCRDDNHAHDIAPLSEWSKSVLSGRPSVTSRAHLNVHLLQSPLNDEGGGYFSTHFCRHPPEGLVSHPLVSPAKMFPDSSAAIPSGRVPGMK